MGTQEMTEREINLVDLFWSILFGWRKIICFGILFAVLISGLKYFLDIRDYHAFQNIDIEKEKSNLGKDALKQLSDAVKLQVRIDDFENYREKSSIMQIDPYAKPVLELQYYVQSDYIINYTKDSERDYTLELVSMYSNYINSGEMAQRVIEDAGLSITTEDFRELLSVSSNESTIFISISYADVGKLNQISESVKNFLQEKQPELQDIGSHTLKLIDESQNVVVDTALAEKKNTIANNVTTLETQLKNLKASMSTEQITLFDLEVSEMRGEDIEEEDEPGFSIIYVILGGMVGAFLVCAWIVCRMIFASKLQSSVEIRSLYGARLLGEIEISGPKKRFLSGIDNLILNLKNKGKKRIASEQQIKVIAASVALSCKQHGIECIYMTGSEYDKADKTILDKLKKELAGQKVKIKDGSNMLYDADSLQAGVEIGHVVLVEQKEVSTYDEIYAELNLLKEYQSDILGVIVLE